MKGKTRSFTFRIDEATFAALERLAADKEWSTGHLVNSALAEYVARVGKPAKAKRVNAAKSPPKPTPENPAAAEPPANTPAN